MLKQENYQRLAGVLKTILRILFWVSTVVALLSAIFAVVVLILPAQTWEVEAKGKIFVSLGGVLRHVAEVPQGELLNYRPMLLAISTSLAVGLGITAVVYRLLAGILQTVKDMRPFVKENADRITAIGAIVLAGSIIAPLVQAAVTYAAIMVYGIPNLNINISPDLTIVFVGLLLLVLAGVFRYGSYLQDEVDTTL